MAIILLQPDGVPISATAERQGSAALYGGGANRPLGGRSGFRADMAADVFTATTTAWTLKPCSAMIDPGASTHQGMYGWATTTNITGTPAPPDATLPRKDVYFIQLNDSTAGDGSGSVSANVYALTGTPASNPVSPWDTPSRPERSFLVATVTVPQEGGGNPTVVLNPARFAAAGAPLPVYSAAERDALVKYDGLIVQRRDLPGRPMETYSGSAWFTAGGDTGWLDLPLINGFTPFTGAAWPGAKYRIKNGWCIIDGAVQNAAAWVANTAAAQIPVAARPGVKIQGFNGVIVENTQGYMTIPAGGAGSAFSFSITYPVD